MSCRWMKLPVSLFDIQLLSVSDRGSTAGAITDGTCFLSVHAAVIAINEAIDRGKAPATMAALNNPNAMMRNAQEALAEDYQDKLSQTKARKLKQSSEKVQKRINYDLIVIPYLTVFISTCHCLD